MRRFKFDCHIGEALPAEFVSKANSQFPVLNEKDWPIIADQIQNCGDLVIDTSYIPEADFINESNPDLVVAYTEISFPLFNKDKNVCILRVSTLGFCSEHQIRIYKKCGRKWELYELVT